MRKKIATAAREIKQETNREYYETVRDILEHPVVRKMSEFKHHYGTSCYRHCLNVSYMNFIICRKLHLDARAAARAGMLHDLFLYDWHKHSKETGNRFHGLTHPRYAMNMAGKHFELSKKEKDIILRHMWPITITPPSSPEGFVITLTDKISGIFEAADYYTKKLCPERKQIDDKLTKLNKKILEFASDKLNVF